MKSMEDLTGFEVIEMKKRLKRLGAGMNEDGGMELIYVLASLFKKREEPSTTLDDVLGLTINEVQEYLGLNDEEEVAVPFEATGPKE